MLGFKVLLFLLTVGVMSPLIAFVAFTVFLQVSYADWYNRRPETTTPLHVLGAQGINWPVMAMMFRQKAQPDMSGYLRLGLRIHKVLCVLLALCLATAIVVGLVHPIGS